MASAAVELGVLLHTRHLIKEIGETSFDQVWADAESAEELGFDQVWLGDSVTIPDKARGDCLTMMAAVAAKTQRVRIGAVPFLAALRNPVSLAHALATLDVISGGRIIVGASVGSVKRDMNEQFDACGVPHPEKAGRLNESVEIMRRLWTEKAVTFEGRYYQIQEVGILPHPVQKPAIPIWIATGKNDKALKRAARLGDGWITNASTLEVFSGCLRAIDGYATQYGREGNRRATALYAAFNMGSDGARAREEGWSWMEDFFHQPRAKLGQHLVIFGTPDECAATIRGYRRAGLTGVIARFAAANQRDQMRLFLQELKPRLAE